MFDRSRTRFHGKKAAQHFHCAVSKVFDRVKSVALWSANIRKLVKDHKGYGSAASSVAEYHINCLRTELSSLLCIQSSLWYIKGMINAHQGKMLNLLYMYILIYWWNRLIFMAHLLLIIMKKKYVLEIRCIWIFLWCLKNLKLRKFTDF